MAISSLRILFRLAPALLPGLLACSGGAESITASPNTNGTSARAVAQRVWYNPYDGVDWRRTLRLKAQTHDHAAAVSARLLSYDSAGYDLVPLMTYSGVASLDYALTSRLWMPEQVVSRTVSEAMRSIKAFVPSGEEVGFRHVTSLFLTSYIAKWEPLKYAFREPWMYNSTQEAIDLINASGGFAILAHPWDAWTSYANLTNYRGMEIYSAFAEFRHAASTEPFYTAQNRNIDLASAWDRALLSGRMIVGVAVNDHYGPYNANPLLTPRVRDSGKILALTDRASLEGFREAMEAGSVFAVRDFGATKGNYPIVDSLWYAADTVHVATNDVVTWIVDGVRLASSSRTLALRDLPARSRYVRAEITNADGSAVFTQPMLLRRRGDIDGNGVVDVRDASICSEILSGNDLSSGADSLRIYDRACQSR